MHNDMGQGDAQQIFKLFVGVKNMLRKTNDGKVGGSDRARVLIRHHATTTIAITIIDKTSTTTTSAKVLLWTNRSFCD
jgi:hypothetical protein